MTDLEKTISDFKNWGQPWTFHQFVLESPQLNETDKEFFNNIWFKASVPEIWNHADVTISIKECREFIKVNYGVSDDTINALVRAISYDWK